MSLKLELKKVGWTKQDLADRLGITYRTVLRMGDEVTVEVQRLLDATLSMPLPDRDFEEEVEPLVSVQLRRVMARKWKLDGTKIRWLGRWYGSGSEYDFTQSAQNISEIRKMIKEMGVDGTVQQMAKYGAVQKETGEWIPAWPADFVKAVKNNTVCPVIVDEIESRFEGGSTIAFRTDPWKITTEVGEGFKVDEYFVRKVS